MSESAEAAVRLYTRDALELRQDGPGIEMWAVSLEHSMLTYFELAPATRFETHSHESEQITLVLEGVLYFELADALLEVGPGEVIALPSNTPHAVYSGDQPVKAVDAWSPVMPGYQ